MRLVVQVAKKGRRASSIPCMLAFVQASWKVKMFDGSIYLALHMGVVSILLTARYVSFTYHLSASSVGIGPPSGAAISEYIYGRIHGSLKKSD